MGHPHLIADGQEWRELEVTVDEIGPSATGTTALPTKTTAKPNLTAVPSSDEPPF